MSWDTWATCRCFSSILWTHLTDLGWYWCVYCVCVYMYMCVHMCVHVCVHICVCVYTCVCAHTCTCVSQGLQLRDFQFIVFLFFCYLFWKHSFGKIIVNQPCAEHRRARAYDQTGKGFKGDSLKSSHPVIRETCLRLVSSQAKWYRSVIPILRDAEAGRLWDRET